ncbi:MAG TPA: tyrosine--tRNA ligase [Candidatus Dormibacteraeota bacterium]|nr:tyrosine--tRNA ligase [Candidatus Dormibacteraeota bacterium]
MTLSEELAWRGLVNQTTYKEITVLDGEPITFYWGVDPSADSMTIGNLAAAMMVKCFIKHGHRAVLLVGGATGLIGDPDGKSTERSLKSIEEIAANKQTIANQYSQVFGGGHFELVDNYDWFKDMRYLDFLRDVGKHVPMRQMLARDFVQARLGEQGAGISYAEFSYVLIQAYDFLRLYQDHGVTLQVCGSDQWGNSIAGVDLIRRMAGGEAHVYSVPLVINQATGSKFGKTEAGAIWLDAAKTSIYKFYQFWLNVDDEGVEGYLKIFTELDKDAIDGITSEFNEKRGARLAQKTLAFEVTKLVHGQAAAEAQQRIAAVLFGSDDALELGADEFTALEKELPTARVPKQISQDDLINALVETGLASSKTEARQFLGGGAIYINNQKMPGDFHFDAQSRSAVMVRRGKNSNAILKFDN